MKFWMHILEDLVLQQLEREKDLLTSAPGERFEKSFKAESEAVSGSSQ